MIKRDILAMFAAVCLIAFCSGQGVAREISWAGGCGDGAINSGEECDPGIPGLIDPDLGGKNCEGEGYSGGELMCTAADRRGSGCKVDRSACYCNALTSFPATGQSTCWDRSGRVIDCRGTGHDGDVHAGAPLSYTDNGDGTITDDNTKLMWEKKHDSGGIHDKDALYDWEGAFSVFTDALNNTCEGDGYVQCDSDDFCGVGGRCGFAGYRDWRIPNVKEMQSIVNYNMPYPGPTVHPAFDRNCTVGCVECSCTVSSNYWSSSSNAYFPFLAWNVDFSLGNVNRYSKDDGLHVRAVRGGI